MINNKPDFSIEKLNQGLYFVKIDDYVMIVSKEGLELFDSLVKGTYKQNQDASNKESK